MTFKEETIYRMSYDVQRYIKRFETKIKPDLSPDTIAEIEGMTSSVLDSTNKVYSYLNKENSDIAIFDKIATEINNNKRREDGEYLEKPENDLERDYIESGKHNTLYYINRNEALYGNKLSNYLMGLSNSCTIFLNEQATIQKHQRSPTIRFNLPATSPKTLDRDSTASLSDGSSNGSPDEKNKGASME